MISSIGALKVNRIIETSTILSLGSLFICWINCQKSNPSIMDTAMEYPYTIIFRVCMLYSLFIFFLQIIFIKFMLDSSTILKPLRTRFGCFLGIVGIAAYGLFVACIDRKRINYQLAHWCVFISVIAISLSFYIYFTDLLTLKNNFYPLSSRSWIFKKITIALVAFGFVLGVLIYLGLLDIDLKNKVEYCIVVNSIMFLWSFVYEFKKFELDIDHLPSS